MDILSHKHPRQAYRIGAGAVTGLIAGIVMAIPLMLYHITVPGHDAFYPTNIIATWVGIAFSPSGFGMNSVVGLVIHLLFSALLGAFWGFVFTRTPDKVTSAIGGMIYGILIYWAVEYFAAPLLNPTFTQTIGIPMLMAHLLFGACFAIYPILVDKFSHDVH